MILYSCVISARLLHCEAIKETRNIAQSLKDYVVFKGASAVIEYSSQKECFDITIVKLCLNQEDASRFHEALLQKKDRVSFKYFDATLDFLDWPMLDSL